MNQAMSRQLTIEDARQSLNAHLAAKGAEIQAKYGPQIGWRELEQVLADRSCVRYPCEVRFEAGQLLPGEFAHPVPISERPDDGFIIYVHPAFGNCLDRAPYLVFYQLVLVNYGEFASTDDAETFGANALGLSKDDYYRALCEMADEITATSKT
jgi:hypothetical protein